jgi:hypothetical protein
MTFTVPVSKRAEITHNAIPVLPKAGNSPIQTTRSLPGSRGGTLVGLRPGGHGLELGKVVGPVEAALVDGAGEVVELPLLLEVEVRLQRRRDLVGPHEEPRIHPPRAGTERLPPRARHCRRHVRVLVTSSRAVGGSDARTLRSCATVSPCVRN